MRVERQPGDPPKGLDRPGTEGEVRYEVPVHHIEMDPIGARSLAPPDRVPEVGEVGVEDARCDSCPTGRH